MKSIHPFTWILILVGVVGVSICAFIEYNFGSISNYISSVVNPPPYPEYMLHIRRADTILRVHIMENGRPPSTGYWPLWVFESMEEDAAESLLRHYVYESDGFNYVLAGLDEGKGFSDLPSTSTLESLLRLDDPAARREFLRSSDHPFFIVRSNLLGRNPTDLLDPVETSIAFGQPYGLEQDARSPSSQTKVPNDEP